MVRITRPYLKSHQIIKTKAVKDNKFKIDYHLTNSDRFNSHLAYSVESVKIKHLVIKVLLIYIIVGISRLKCQIKK